MPSRIKITSKGQITDKVIKTQSLSTLLGALPAKPNETDFAEIRKQALLAIANPLTIISFIPISLLF
jgi:hypothetical protein